MGIFPPYFKGPIIFPIVGPIISTIKGGVYSDIIAKIKACDPLLATDQRVITAQDGRPVPQGQHRLFTGTEKITAAHLTGSETVVSSYGTSTPTVAAGEITFTAGTCAILLLSDGTLYDMQERVGTVAFDSSGAGNGGVYVNAPASIDDNSLVPDPANTRGFTEGTGSNGIAIGGILVTLISNPAVDVAGNATQWKSSGYAMDWLRTQSNARLFDGVDQSMQATISTSAEGYTVSGWVKPADNSVSTVLFAGNSSTFNQMLVVGVNSIATSFDIRVRSAAFNTVVSGGSFVVGQWYFLEAYFSEDLRTLRVAGVEVINETANMDLSGITVNVAAAAANADSSPSNYFDGSISSPIFAGKTYPLAEGSGSIAYCTDGVSHGTYVNSPANTLQDVVSSNLDNGFSDLAGVLVPALEGSIVLDATGATLTNPPVTDGHNGAETLFNSNTADDGDQPPAIHLASPSIPDTYEFGDAETDTFRFRTTDQGTDRFLAFSTIPTGECLIDVDLYTLDTV